MCMEGYVDSYEMNYKIHPPRIELGTSRVLGERHNQLDQGCCDVMLSVYLGEH